MSKETAIIKATVKRLVKKYLTEFYLCGHSGVFMINEEKSYHDGASVKLVIDVKSSKNGVISWSNFCTCTVQELEDQVNQ